MITVWVRQARLPYEPLPSAPTVAWTAKNKFSHSWERRTPVRLSPEGAKHTSPGRSPGAGLSVVERMI